MSIEKLHVGVVGASIAGLMTAHALARRGASVELFERSLLLPERGAGIMLEARVAASIGGLCTRAYTERRVLGSQLQLCWSKPLSKMACSWADLYRCLRARVSDSAIHVGVAVVDCTADGALHLADGRRCPFDIVIGADGVGSTVRGILGHHFQPTYCGYVAMRGMIEASCLPACAQGLWQAVSSGHLLNLFAPHSHAVLYAPPGATNCSLNWIWYCNVDDLEALFTDAQGKRHRWSLPPDRMTPPLRQRLLEQARPLLPKAMVEIMAATPSPYLQAIYHGLPDAFAAGQIALVGDAAHVSPPHLGAATSIAYQDVQTLVDALEAGQPLEQWGAQRRQAVQGDLDIAQRLGHSLQFEDHRWDDWERADYDEWWDALTQGQRLYFDR